MVIADRFANVELIDLHAVHFVFSIAILGLPHHGPRSRAGLRGPTSEADCSQP
jgi:hypothetical protein